MDRDIMKNIFFIIIGIVLLGIVELKVMQLTEIIMLVLGLIGFVALIDGIFGLYNALRTETKTE